MPRPKRKEIKLTHESAVALMQEIYNECVEQRTTAIRIQNKMIGFMKEAADMALIGPVLKEQQKIIDYLDIETQKINQIILVEMKRIDLLKEYKKSLISEVVTGKKRVV